jgi:hypothetical protein
MRDNEVFEVWLVRERSRIQEGTLRLLLLLRASAEEIQTDERLGVCVGALAGSKLSLPNCTAAPHPKLADRGKRGSETTLARINSRISA